MVAEILTKYRLENGMTQAELAKTLNITQAAVSHYESGRRVPGIKVMSRIKKLTGCPAEALIPEPRQRPSA